MPTPAFSEAVRELKGYGLQYYLSPKQVENFEAPCALGWKTVRMDRKKRLKIPSRKGVYAFSVRFSKGGIPPHRYTFYIGQAGHGTNGTLRKRFGAYFHEKRPKLRYYFDTYEGYVDFSYSTVSSGTDLKELEEALCDAVIPPAVQQDFSAQMRPVIKALRQ